MRFRRVPVWKRWRYRFTLGRRPSSLGGALKSFPGVVLSIAKFLLAVIVVVILPLMVIRDLGRSLIVIERISVPKAVSEAGYTAEAVAHDVRSAIVRLDSETYNDSRRGKPTSIRGSDEKDSLDFQIPGTKMGYQQMVQFLRERLVKEQPTRVGGKILQRDGKTWAVIRITEPSYPAVEETITDVADLSQLSSAIAGRVLAVLKPAILASYLYYRAHDETKARCVLKACRERQDPIRKADCLVTLGDIARDESQPVIAKAYYEEALEWNPRSPQAHIGLGWLKSDQGDEAAAMQSFEEGLRLNPDNVSSYFNVALLAWRSGTCTTGR
jgi:tetratricopeptide (TPR) repeat protein